MVEPEEGAHWLALLCGGRVKRELAKRVILHWSVQEGECLTGLFSFDAARIAQECGVGEAQASQILAARDAVPVYQRTIEGLGARGVSLMTRADVAYPEALVERLPEDRLPYFLFHVGELQNLTQPAVSILGSLSPSPEASALARELAAALASGGHHLIGGYERGTDRLALDAARGQGGAVTLVLPLGINAFLPVLDKMPDARGGATLVLSPYAPDEPLSDQLAIGRMRLVCALAEAIFLIAPDHRPETWPWLADNVARGCVPFVWASGDAAVTAAWIEASARLFQSVAEARGHAFRLFGAHPEDLDVSDIPLDDDEEELARYESADDAIQALGRSGRVPNGLARRLRDMDAAHRSDRGQDREENRT
ncbi:MAG: hypothetical protein FJZ90_07255 [Chloroflexi bacterium]|nr:hypothetical protein [Chloroflexota bacterium]